MQEIGPKVGGRHSFRDYGTVIVPSKCSRVLSAQAKIEKQVWVFSQRMVLNILILWYFVLCLQIHCIPDRMMTVDSNQHSIDKFVVTCHIYNFDV